MTRFEFLHVLEKRFAPRKVEKTQKKIQALKVNVPLYFRVNQDRFDLRCERDEISFVAVIKRFYANPIPSQQKFLALIVPYRERKHAFQQAKALCPIFFVQMDDHLSVACRGE